MSNLETGAKQDFSNEDVQNVDLRTIDEGRYITPSAAEEQGAKVLEIKNIKIPVSLTIKDNRFRLNGLQPETSKGFVVSGVYSSNAIKINHIFFHEELRRSGLSRVALLNLEAEMRNRGVKVVYASFFKPATIDFFLKNQYEIVSYKTLSEEEQKALSINKNAIDQAVNNKADYENLKDRQPGELKKILLRHNLENI